MANSFLPTSFTVNSTFATLASYLASAGFTGITSNSVTTQSGYIRNADTALNLYVGFGTSAPSSYEIVTPKAAIEFNPGMNVNEIWIKAASSTIVVGFAEGAVEYTPPLVNGVIGTITATENVVPKADSAGDLVASNISDDGTTITLASDVSATGTIISDDATTPGLTIESGNTNTGFIDMKGKTSGKIRITTADATAQTVTVTAAAQTSGASTLTIPDQAGVSSSFVFTTLAQTLTNKTLTSPVIGTGLTASGSAANTFAGSTGTFITSTGANTLSGAVDVNDATTPSITLNSGKTNTGFLLINGKTSGSTQFITADATAQAVVVSTAAQTSGGCTLTIPDQAGVSSAFVFTTLAQTLTNKTLTAPVLGVATGTSLAVTGLISSSSPTTGIGYATGAGGAVTQATDKSTGVASNTITTAITMNNATLNADTTVSFTFTNTAIAATDTVLVAHQSAGTSGSYVFNAFPGAGSAVISVRNITAGNLTEAIVLRVTVIKSVSA